MTTAEKYDVDIEQITLSILIGKQMNEAGAIFPPCGMKTNLMKKCDLFPILVNTNADKFKQKTNYICGC